MTDEMTYEIEPRTDGCWVMAVVDDLGNEIAGGIFPPGDDGYREAIEEAESIIESMGGVL